MRTISFLIPILFVISILDGVLKRIALKAPFPSTSESLFDLVLHKNSGIAFNIPLPIPAVLFVTFLIIIAILIECHQKQQPIITLAGTMIVLGATNNAIDRVIHGFTTDYILLFGRSVINLSDVLILTGALVFAWYYKSIPRAVHYS